MGLLNNSGIQRKARILSLFLVGQGCAQALNLLNGFLVLHWLSVVSYGQYGLTFGFQTTVNMLIDLGFSTTIVALVGHRTTDRAILGNYIRSGRSLRARMLLIVLPISLIVYFYMTERLKWGTGVQVVLFLSIIVSIYFSGFQAYYGAPLIVQRKLGTYYRIQIFSALFKVVVCALFYKFGVLNALVAAWVNACGIALAGLLYRYSSSKLLDEPERANPAVTQQMLRYVMPNIPGVIFFALQGQIAVFLIAAFGRTSGIAQVAALSRIGQIFTLVAALNSTVLEPWFAKSPAHLVLKRYFMAAGITIFFSTLFVLFATVTPGALLWILGKQYSNLQQEVKWTVLGGCINYLMGMTWTAISGRRLIYWGTTFLNIGLILISQVTFIVLSGVDTPLQAVKFSCTAATASLIAQVVNLIYGLKRGPRVDIEIQAHDSSQYS